MSIKITCSDKDRDGDITSIGSPPQTWSRIDAVRLIKLFGVGYFYVQQPGTRPADIHVFRGEYLRTDPDGDPRNNLDNLTACGASY